MWNLTKMLVLPCPSICHILKWFDTLLFSKSDFLGLADFIKWIKTSWVAKKCKCMHHSQRKWSNELNSYRKFTIPLWNVPSKFWNNWRVSTRDFPVFRYFWILAESTLVHTLFGCMLNLVFWLFNNISATVSLILGDA